MCDQEGARGAWPGPPLGRTDILYHVEKQSSPLEKARTPDLTCGGNSSPDIRSDQGAISFGPRIVGSHTTGGGEARTDRSLERILEAIAGEATSHSSPHSFLLYYQEGDLGMERSACKHGGIIDN